MLLDGNQPPRAPAHPWLVPQQPWEHVHVDHAQWGKWLLLVAIDAFLKWPKVFVASSTSTSQTIDKLLTMFATHGLPVTGHTDIRQWPTLHFVRVFSFHGS